MLTLAGVVPWCKNWSILAYLLLLIQWLKKMSQCLLFLKDQIGVIFWHNLATWPVNVKNYNILAFQQALSHIIWIRTDYVMNQTKWPVIGTIFWACIFLICNIAQIVCGTSQQGHIILFALIWHVELGSWTSLPFTISIKAISVANALLTFLSLM